MNIDYKGMLPVSKTCEHSRVDWLNTEPNARPKVVIVTVTCMIPKCYMTATKEFPHPDPDRVIK